MSDNSYQKYFQIDPKNIWLNAASEGPLPKISAQALNQVVERKSLPHQLTFEYFAKVPVELKKAIGQLIGLSYRDVILGNSATYGLHLLANGISWKKGDQILLMKNDFPTNILPWLDLEKQGVDVVQLSAKNRMLTSQELEEAITDQTRLVCLSHVHTFSGVVLDWKACAEICQKKGVRFVLNIAQSAGNMLLNFSGTGVDAVVCAGYKWLLGPYGTGFAWIDPDWRRELDYNQAYWISEMNEKDLSHEDVLEAKNTASARKYDVFGTANFFNFVPWTASIELLLQIGLENIHQHNQDLIDLFLSDFDSEKYHLISDQSRTTRSNLVVFSCVNSEKNPDLHQHLLSNGLHTALWKNNIRVSPHLFNTKADIHALQNSLNRFEF